MIGIGGGELTPAHAPRTQKRERTSCLRTHRSLKYHGPFGVAAVAMKTSAPGSARRSAASALGTIIGPFLPTSDLLKQGENFAEGTMPSPICQICQLSSAVAFVLRRATVLCDHGIMVGMQISPLHCSGEKSKGPTGDVLTKCALEETVVHLLRELCLHMNEAYKCQRPSSPSWARPPHE